MPARSNPFVTKISRLFLREKLMTGFLFYVILKRIIRDSAGIVVIRIFVLLITFFVFTPKTSCASYSLPIYRNVRFSTTPKLVLMRVCDHRERYYVCYLICKQFTPVKVASKARLSKESNTAVCVIQYAPRNYRPVAYVPFS